VESDSEIDGFEEDAEQTPMTEARPPKYVREEL
jgi:hypothetical protein